MAKIYLGLFGLTLTSAIALTSANAADMYRNEGSYKDAPAYVPVNTWTGFYAGVNAGYGFSSSDNQLGFSDGANSFTGLSPQGGFGGGQIGYNWQGALNRFGFGPSWVLGVEADIQASDISDDFTLNSNGGTAHTSSNLNWFGTIRGRVGYAFGPSLIYFTGGFAYGDIENKITAAGAGQSDTVKKDTTATGYVLGAGYEYKISPSWSVKAEYQYINLGKNDPSDAGTPVSAEGFNVHDDAFHTIRFGVNYHLDAAGYDPLK